jgi:hypothetical protein
MLGERAQGVLGAGEGGEAVAAAHAGGGAGEQDRALPSRRHPPGGLAAGEEAREGGHLPDLEIDPRRGLRDREADVRANVEDADLDRRDLGFDPLEQLDHLLLLAGVDAERMDLAAGLSDRLGQGLQLVGFAAHDDCGKALAGEPPGDRSAQCVSRPDHDDRLVRHGRY